MRAKIVVVSLGCLVASLGALEWLRRTRAPDPPSLTRTVGEGERSAVASAPLPPSAGSPARPERPLPSEPGAGADSKKFQREVETRGKENFEATLAWARGLQSDEVRDRALGILCQCLTGFIPDNIDIPRAIVLADEIRDPAIRLTTQGRIAVYWAGWKPEQAMSWALFLPEKATPKTPPADEGERIAWYEYDSRERILLCSIQRWTMWGVGPDGERVYPETRVNQARLWIADASLSPAIKNKLLSMLPKKP